MGKHKHYKKRGPYTKNACLHCRESKSKCDDNIPCGQCRRKLKECIKPEIENFLRLDIFTSSITLFSF